MEVIMSTKQGRLTALQIIRIKGGELIEQGYSDHEIAEVLSRGLSTVRGWRKIVREQGVEALAPKPRPGRTPKLGNKQLAKLKRLLKKGATKFGYANAIWTSRRVRQLIQDKFGVIHSARQVRRVLRKIGYSPKKPVKRSKKYSTQKIEHWRRYKWPHIKKVA
jgi:transposase